MDKIQHLCVSRLTEEARGVLFRNNPGIVIRLTSEREVDPLNLADLPDHGAIPIVVPVVQNVHEDAIPGFVNLEI